MTLENYSSFGIVLLIFIIIILVIYAIHQNKVGAFTSDFINEAQRKAQKIFSEIESMQTEAIYQVKNKHEEVIFLIRRIHELKHELTELLLKCSEYKIKNRSFESLINEKKKQLTEFENKIKQS